MVHALTVLRYQESAERGLGDLLDDDGADDLAARDAIAPSYLCGVVDAVERSRRWKKLDVSQ
jgi:hypothetical protein